MIIGPRFWLHRLPIKEASKQKTRIQTDTERWGIYRRRPFLNTYNEIVPLNRRRITPGSIYWVFHVHKTIREKDTTTGRSTLLPRFDDIIPFNIGFSPVDWPTDIYNWTPVGLFDFWQLELLSRQKVRLLFARTHIWRES